MVTDSNLLCGVQGSVQEVMSRTTKPLHPLLCIGLGWTTPSIGQTRAIACISSDWLKKLTGHLQYEVYNAI